MKSICVEKDYKNPEKDYQRTHELVNEKFLDLMEGTNVKGKPSLASLIEIIKDKSERIE